MHIGLTTEMNRPTPAMVMGCLTSLDPTAPDAVWARRLVLRARETVTRHAQIAWVTKARAMKAELRNGGPPPSCGCRQCEWLPRIAEVLLPEENRIEVINPEGDRRPAVKPTYWTENLNE
jgi:hypothetical protein